MGQDVGLCLVGFVYVMFSLMRLIVFVHSNEFLDDVSLCVMMSLECMLTKCLDNIHSTMGPRRQ